MSIPLKDFRATVWKVDDKGNYAQVQMSTSRKDKKTGEYCNSSWGFVNFVLSAYDKIDSLQRGTRIVVNSGTLKKEPYTDNEGVKQYPKNPTMTVFDFDIYQPDNNFDKPPDVEVEDLMKDVAEDPAEDLPF